MYVSFQIIRYKFVWNITIKWLKQLNIHQLQPLKPLQYCISTYDGSQRSHKHLGIFYPRTPCPTTLFQPNVHRSTADHPSRPGNCLGHPGRCSPHKSCPWERCSWRSRSSVGILSSPSVVQRRSLAGRSRGTCRCGPSRIWCPTCPVAPGSLPVDAKRKVNSIVIELGRSKSLK